MSSISHASVTSGKREKVTTEQIESVRAMNNSLRAYLEHLRAFKKNLTKMNENCTQLGKVNQQWTDVLNNMR